MRRLITIFILCVGCLTVVNAQSSFTKQLQKRVAGEGTITITQDKAIDDLVNGHSAAANHSTPQQKTERKDASQEKKQETKPAEEKTVAIVTPDSVDTQKKIMKGYKVKGYRVQVFAGGNSRNDRLKAEEIGNTIKSLFPNEPVYVHFYSPRWICRIGNYRTYEEAHEILANVKKLGYNSAIIVKGKITVQY